jgi:uncharacterized protein (DUF1697 family)
MASRRTTYAALLRAVNLGAHNKISMSALRAVFDELGCEDVATYVQSGNVVFTSRRGVSSLRGAIEGALEREFGIRPAVLLRTEPELRKLVRANPYVDRVDDPRRLHVIFLDSAPDRGRVRALDGAQFAPDELQVVGRDVFAFYPRGYARTKLTNATVEKLLGVTATSRNWRTVTTLAELASART